MPNPIAKHRFILLHENDNVATALEDLPAGTEIALEQGKRAVLIAKPVFFTHKFAVRDIAADEDVIKYGVPIGRAMMPICAGEHVHLHNLRSIQMEGNADAGVQAGGWKNRNT